MSGELMKQKERQKKSLLQGTMTMQKNAYAKEFRQPAGSGMPDGAFPEAGGASFVSVPKAARKKRVRGGKKLSRESYGVGGGGGGAAAPQDALEEKHEAWTDLTEEERMTESVRTNEELRADLNFYAKDDMSPRDLSKGEKPKQFDFEKLSDRVQNIIKTVAEVTEKPKLDETSKERRERINKEGAVVRALNDTLRFIREEQAGKTVTDAKYNALTMQEKEILSTYAVRLLPLYRGSLEVEEKGILDMTTKDDEFKVQDKTVDPPIDNGTTLLDKKVCTLKDYTKVPLFTHEPNTFDIKQGNIGDCYMLSGLSALLSRDPEFIKGCMKDEGDTVAVRFYQKTGEPFFVRVKKTLPETYYTGKNKTTGKSEESVHSPVGARDVLWVRMFEKAFAAARQHLEPEKVAEKKVKEKDPNLPLMKQIAGGHTGEFIQFLTGKKMKEKYLPGIDEVYFPGKGDVLMDRRFDERLTLGELLTGMQSKGKKRFKEELKKGIQKFTDDKWTQQKAKEMFGIDISSMSDQVKSMFSDKDNDYIVKYGKFMLKHLENFTRDSFHSILDADYFLSTIDRTKMPELKVPGLDEEKMKTHFLKYFRDYIRTESGLANTINRTGNYKKEETKVYNEFEKALAQKKLVTTGSGKLSFEMKDGTGLNGESTLRGIAGTHAYTVLGVKTKEDTINGKKVEHRFVVLANPWAEQVRLYDKNTGLPYLAEEKDASEQAENHGVFEMELRDYLNTFRQYWIND